MSDGMPRDFLRLECLRIAHENSPEVVGPEMLIFSASMLAQWVLSGEVPDAVREMRDDVSILKEKYTN